VRDKRSAEAYKENLLRGRKTFPQLLQLFEQFGIYASRATVGFLRFLKYRTPINKPEAYRTDFRIFEV